MALFEENMICPIDTVRLKDLMPSFYFEDDGTTEKFVSIFDEQYCQLMNDIEDFARIIDIDLTDERFIDLILLSLGFNLDVFLSLDKKRKLAKVIIDVYKGKGTAAGIENVIRQFTGIDALVFPFTTGWELGVSELGFNTYLNPSPLYPAEFYTFDVIVYAHLSQEQRRVILLLIDVMKPAWTHLNALIEEATDLFLQSGEIMMNRGSLYLFNEQNTDGGWDAIESDSLPGTISDRENVARYGVGETYSWMWHPLASVLLTAQGAVGFLLGVTYAFATVIPEPGDIKLLNLGVSPLAVGGSASKRDEAAVALTERMKAMGFLNSYAATPAQLAATSVAERNSASQDKQAQFLYLYLTNTYGIGDGLVRYVRYMLDFEEIGDDAFVVKLASRLSVSSSVVPLESGFGTALLKANAALVVGLQKDNLALSYETRILEAISIIDARFSVPDKLYIDTVVGSGRMEEQAMILDAWMDRKRFDAAKELIEGIHLKQRVNGTFDDPIDVGTSRLRSIGFLMDSAGRALKKISDDAL